MEKVKRLVAAGSSFTGAVKEALAGVSLDLSTLAEKRDVPRKDLSGAVNLRVVPTPKVLAALTAELGGTPDEWLAFWWAVATPKEPSAAKKKAVASR